jgi:hypothetical protein
VSTPWKVSTSSSYSNSTFSLSVFQNRRRAPHDHGSSPGAIAPSQAAATSAPGLPRGADRDPQAELGNAPIDCSEGREIREITTLCAISTPNNRSLLHQGCRGARIATLRQNSAASNERP